MTDGERPEILGTLARAYYQPGEPAKAIESVRRALSLLGADASRLRTELETDLGTYLAAGDGRGRVHPTASKPK